MEFTVPSPRIALVNPLRNPCIVQSSRMTVPGCPKLHDFYNRAIFKLFIFMSGILVDSVLSFPSFSRRMSSLKYLSLAFAICDFLSMGSAICDVVWIPQTLHLIEWNLSRLCTLVPILFCEGCFTHLIFFSQRSVTVLPSVTSCQWTLPSVTGQWWGSSTTVHVGPVFLNFGSRFHECCLPYRWHMFWFATLHSIEH